ncbi:MAG TPA: acetate/propionate family kinase [Solirubrobacteraceae bacterium]
MRVLVVNAGSSSVKLTLLDAGDETLAERELAAPRARADPAELKAALAAPFSQADAVGHRIVHGGELFREAVPITAAVRRALGELSDLAPLHQHKSLAVLDAVSEALPHTPAVACFDTAFHLTLPPAAATYALPAAWRSKWGLRRYGFHGLSHAWVASRVPEVLALNAHGLRIISCHLGAGASVCAIADGRSLDTTMGFTPLEGLVMATRSGSVDPGLLLWLLDHGSLTTAQVADGLEHDSGIKGLCGSPDMREVIERAAGGETSARLALDVYVHRLRGAIAAMAASLGGLDVLSFTGGVGEHAAHVRALATAGLSFLGVQLDQTRNARASADTEIGAAEAPVRALVLSSREDIQIARAVRALLRPR